MTDSGSDREGVFVPAADGFCAASPATADTSGTPPLQDGPTNSKTAFAAVSPPLPAGLMPFPTVAGIGGNLAFSSRNSASGSGSGAFPQADAESTMTTAQLAKEVQRQGKALAKLHDKLDTMHELLVKMGSSGAFAATHNAHSNGVPPRGLKSKSSFASLTAGMLKRKKAKAATVVSPEPSSQVGSDNEMAALPTFATESLARIQELVGSTSMDGGFSKTSLPMRTSQTIVGAATSGTKVLNRSLFSPVPLSIGPDSEKADGSQRRPTLMISQTNIDETRVLEGDSTVNLLMDWVYIVTAAMTVVILVFFIALHPTRIQEPFPLAWFAFMSAFSIGWSALRCVSVCRVGKYDVIDKPTLIRARYFRTWMPFDAFLAIPFEFLGLAASTDPEWVFIGLACKHFLRLVRTFTLLQPVHPLRGPRRYHTMTLLFCFVAMFYNLITCIYVHHEGTSYTTGLYWASATLTTIGYGDVVVSEDWRSFSIICMILGAIVLSATTAAATTYASHEDALTVEVNEKRGKLQSMLHYYNIPWDVQKLAISMFPSVVETDHKQAFLSFVDKLPPDVGSQVQKYIFAKMLSSVPLFNSLPNRTKTLLQIAECAQIRYAQPQEVIIQQGDTGDEMFFIANGVVEIIVRDAKTGESFIVDRQRPGSWFGEMELLNPGTVRGATVQAVTACELLALDSTTFDTVVCNSDDNMRQRFLDDAAQRLGQRKEFGLEEEEEESSDAVGNSSDRSLSGTSGWGGLAAVVAKQSNAAVNPNPLPNVPDI